MYAQCARCDMFYQFSYFTKDINAAGERFGYSVQKTSQHKTT